jgi:hypothetical protein
VLVPEQRVRIPIKVAVPEKPGVHCLPLGLLGVKFESGLLQADEALLSHGIELSGVAEFEGWCGVCARASERNRAKERNEWQTGESPRERERERERGG